MSDDEQIFFDPGHGRPRDAALALAAALGGVLVENSSGTGAALPLDSLEMGAFLTGAVWGNETPPGADPDDPSDEDIFDSFPLLWNVTTGPRRDAELARQGARLAFDALVAADLGWPMVLTHNHGELIATFSRERGLREFPRGVRTDRAHEHLWG